MGKCKTPEERKNSPAAMANSLQKPASLRPESLLDSYVEHFGDARAIIDYFWRPIMGWQSLIKFKVSIDG